MSESSRIADQLARAVDGSAWHGDHLTKLLEGVTAEQAAARPVAGAHGIWELVLHIETWMELPRRSLAGEPLPSTPESTPADWRPVPVQPTEAAWRAARDSLRATAESLRAAVAALPDARLDETTPGRTYSNYVLLHGVVQHTLYHAGQIALLKKA